MMIQTDVFWFSQISHICLLQGPQKSYSILSGGSLVITRMSLKLSHFLKPIIGVFSKTLLRPLSGVKRR